MKKQERWLLYVVEWIAVAAFIWGIYDVFDRKQGDRDAMRIDALETRTAEPASAGLQIVDR